MYQVACPADQHLLMVVCLRHIIPFYYRASGNLIFSFKLTFSSTILPVDRRCTPWLCYHNDNVVLVLNLCCTCCLCFIIYFLPILSELFAMITHTPVAPLLTLPPLTTTISVFNVFSQSNHWCWRWKIKLYDLVIQPLQRRTVTASTLQPPVPHIFVVVFLLAH